jgi:hypothetical protein
VPVVCPRGRPRGPRGGLPFEAVLGQTVIIRENGRERHVTAAQAFLLQLIKRGLDGDGTAARAAIAAIGDLRDCDVLGDYRPTPIVVTFVSPGCVNTAVEPLRIGTKLDRFRETARMMLEPWIVEAALARLGKQLTPEEQEVVLRATRTPAKVRWPDW